MKLNLVCNSGLRLAAKAATLLILYSATANAVEPMPEPGPPLIAPVQDGKSVSNQSFYEQSSIPSVEWTNHKSLDGIDPSPSEQRMMWLMNRARLDPTAEGVWLAESTDPDISGGRSFFGVDLDALKAAFAALDPKPPAAFDIRLHDASELHSLDLIARDAQDHTGQWDKVLATTFACNGSRLSVFSYSDSALNAHAALNIDWGYGPDGMQDPPGHRYAIMGVWPYAGAGLTNVGLAMVPESDPQTNVGPLVFSGAYCQAGTGDHNRFLVGTVWDDLDMDNEYDEGEGLAGVTVMPNQGTYYAVTGDAGGYAIPIEAAGTYSVSFSGGGMGSSSANRTVDVDSASVLLDLELGMDSDGDGVPDDTDLYPNDPTRWQFSALFAIENMNVQGDSGLGLSRWNSGAGRHFAQRIDVGSGSQVNQVSLTPDVVRAVESVPDLNGNGVDEVAVLSVNAGGFVEAKIKDGQTGELLRKMSFEADYDPLWLRVVPDSGSDGSVDIAVLGVNSLGRPRAQVRDALSGNLVSKVYFEASFAPVGFEVIEDLNSDGISELAVIGVDDVGRVRAQVKDVVSGQLRSFVYFDRTYTPSHVTGVDMDGDGHADALALLGENDAGVIRAQVKDVSTATRLGIVRFESGFTSHKLLSMPDANVSGSPELALLQRNDSGSTRVQVKDIVSALPVSLVSFNGNYQPQDMVLVPDVDDNGYPELAFLGEIAVGDHLLQIKDAVTGQLQVYMPIQ